MESKDFFADLQGEDPNASVDPGRVALWFYIAKAPHKKLPVAIRTLSIDDIPVQIELAELPASQGLQVKLGTFPRDRSFQLRWAFDTEQVSGPVDIQVGVYRDSLHNRTVFAKLSVDAYQSYNGLEKVEASAPKPTEERS